jgi:hypothetical protein
MKIPGKIRASFLLIILSVAITFLPGCSVSSEGIGFGPFWYSDPGPDNGYSGRGPDLPLGYLGCEITYPSSGVQAGWEQMIWVYGVIWRQDVGLSSFPWEGPEWYVDNGRIGESYYIFDRISPEVWVRFPLDGRVIGPGQHSITLNACDHRSGGNFPVSDTIYIELI